MAADGSGLSLAEPVRRRQPELVEDAALDALHLEVLRAGGDGRGVSHHFRVRARAEPARSNCAVTRQTALHLMVRERGSNLL